MLFFDVAVKPESTKLHSWSVRPLARATSDSSTSYLPIETIASSEAIGSCCDHCQSVRVSPTTLVSSPLLAAAAGPVPEALVIVFGMSMAMS